MQKRVKNWSRIHPIARLLYPILIITILISVVHTIITNTGQKWIILSLAIFILYLFRPNSLLNTFTIEKITWKGKTLIAVIAVIVVTSCIAPMGQFKLWNGQQPDHRNQYELLAESFYNGRIDLPFDDDEELSKLSNPYNPEERISSGVVYHHDSAYYNNKYYMYFGVVPVVLVFLPYRAITGHALTTYHATQLFVALAILGIFALFYFLSRKFFKKLPTSILILLSIALSILSIHGCIAEPALYCTAISSGLALSIWSIFFFVYAVYGVKKENSQIILATIGSILGALVFGCRPTIALANIIVIPLLVIFLKQHKITPKLIGKLFIAALPYLLIGSALMYYNYIRFDSPFQFGQTYQLTVVDQHDYGFTINANMLTRFFNESLGNLFAVGSLDTVFPYLSYGGVFFNFPILLFCFLIFSSNVRKQLAKNKLIPLIIGIFTSILVIILLGIMWTPFPVERYHQDIYYLIGILSFIFVASWCQSCTKKGRNNLSFLIASLTIMTLASVFLFNFLLIGLTDPELLLNIKNSLHL